MCGGSTVGGGREWAGFRGRRAMGGRGSGVGRASGGAARSLRAGGDVGGNPGGRGPWWAGPGGGGGCRATGERGAAARGSAGRAREERTPAQLRAACRAPLSLRSPSGPAGQPQVTGEGRCPHPTRPRHAAVPALAPSDPRETHAERRRPRVEAGAPTWAARAQGRGREDRVGGGDPWEG